MKNTMGNNLSNTTSLFGDYVLKILGGQMRGMEFPIRKKQFTIGRSPSADIKVLDTLISRVHVRLFLRGKTWFIEDLNSTNGSWIEGQKLTEAVELPLNTTVRIGKTVFEVIDLFTNTDSRPVNTSFFSFRIDPENFIEANDDEKTLFEGSQTNISNQRKLSSLYKFQNSIVNIFSEDELFENFLPSLRSLIVYDNAGVLLYSLETSKFDLKYKKQATPTTSFIDDKIIKYVQDKKEAVLSHETLTLPDANEENKITGLTHSIMCVPMIANKLIKGIVYVTITNPIMRYSQDDLFLLTMAIQTLSMYHEYIIMDRDSAKNTPKFLIQDSEITRGISHSVKNIMASIEGGLELVSAGAASDNSELIMKSKDIIKESYSRLSDITHALISFLGYRVPNKTQVNAVNVIKDVIAELKEELAAENTQVNLNFDKDEYSIIRADKKHFAFAIKNLIITSLVAIHNKSIKEQCPISGEINISVSIDPDTNMVNIMVEDNGLAPTEEYLKNCFESTMHDRGDSITAIYLAVVKKIVLLNNGRVSVKRSNKGGAKYEIAMQTSIYDDVTSTTLAIKRVNIHEA
jgi:signal transduction histidine kinase